MGWRKVAWAVVSVLLVVAVVVGASVFDAPAAVVGVAGALGAAALTQWNQRWLAARADEARKAERAEAALHRAEDRAEKRAEWARAHTVAAYERFVAAQRSCIEAHLRMSIVMDREAAGSHDDEAAAGIAAMVVARREAFAQLSVWGSDSVIALARLCLERDRQVPGFVPGLEYHFPSDRRMLSDAFEGASNAGADLLAPLVDAIQAEVRSLSDHGTSGS